MFKRIILILFGLLLVVGVIAGVKVLQVRKMIAASKHTSFPPAIVTTAKVTAETWQSTLTAVGSLVAVQGVTVAAELPGKVVEIIRVITVARIQETPRREQYSSHHGQHQTDEYQYGQS